MTEHRPASDEAFNRTAIFQTGFLVLVCWIFLAALLFRGRLTSFQGFLVGVGSIPLCYLLTKAVRGASAVFAETAIGGLFSAGNIKYQHTYSRQESLIARGQFDDAVESFQVHLMEFPDDIPGRYRLATLHLRERNDPAAGEAELLNIRRRKHDRSTAMLLANHFVDIYRATGQTGKLMAELNKMIREWPGTPMAEGAAKLLEETRRARS